MCMDSGGQDSGEEMRKQEEERQARIREGTNAISNIFGGNVSTEVPGQEAYQITDYSGSQRGEHGEPKSNGGTTTAYRPITTIENSTAPGQFGDDFFNNLEKNYLDYYMPQYNRQAGDADRGLRIGLARSGNLTGSVGAREIGRLAQDKESERRRLIDESIKYSTGQRKSLEDTRGNLIGQLESGAGVENVAGQATAAANAMTAPPAFSPLGDLFKNYTAAVANSSAAAGQPGFPGAEQYRRSLLFNIPSSGGSGSASYS